MFRYFIALVGLVSVTGCAAHSSPGPLTPDPKDYPCHNEDGSADPNANWCYPVDGTHTCCRENNSCSSLEGQPVCEYQGPAVGPGGNFDEARKPMSRTKDSY
jgi:hypothetical protein